MDILTEGIDLVKKHPVLFTPFFKENFIRNFCSVPAIAEKLLDFETKILEALEININNSGIQGSLSQKIIPIKEKFSVLPWIFNKKVVEILCSIPAVAQAIKNFQEDIIKILNERKLKQSIRKPLKIHSVQQTTPLASEEVENPAYETLTNYIVGCSNFDENGRVVQFFDNSTATLGTVPTLEALTPDSIGTCEVSVRTVDDMYEDFPYDEILEQAKNEKQKVVVSLAGIQTNQYERALYIALMLKKKAIEVNIADKIDIVFGGFHVRNHKESQKEIMKYGFSVFNGEAEGRYGQVISDAAHNRMEKEYNFEGGKNFVKLNEGYPMPKLTKELMAGYLRQPAVVIQLARGCPFSCSFCSVMGTDGKEIRPRSLEDIKNMFRSLSQEGISNIFLADDNFYRHDYKMEILDFLIKLREEENITFDIMIQTELSVHKSNGKVDKEFIEKCKKAGVSVVFVGTESFDYEVLKAMKKGQNIKGGKEEIIKNMKRQREAWNEQGIVVNATCIIGHEQDKKGVGKRSAEVALKAGFNIVSPFIYTLLPGSMDFKTFLENGKATIVGSFNDYHRLATVQWNNPNSLTPEQIQQEYQDFLNSFYTPKNMKKVCINPLSYQFFIWYMLSNSMGRFAMNNGLVKREIVETKNCKELEEAKNVCEKQATKFL